MAYTPTEWETADIVTATRMNALETAVGDMNMSYTPNTWSDGDILTAAKMNALEQAVASGGGGGSSDFFTAEVTIVNTNESNRSAQIIFMDFASDPSTEYFTGFYIDDELGVCNTMDDTINIQDNSSTTQTIYILNDKAVSFLIFIHSGDDVTVQGNAIKVGEVDDGVIGITVTGDCTITIS